jgi:hypothetical protein
MKRTVLYGPGEIRFERRETPRIAAVTHAVVPSGCVDRW